jgi:hypothetical protein
MCDILVLCEPDIIIFSVKEVKPNRTARDDVRFRRWVRGAVDESVAQIYGAERFIQSDRHPHVVQESGSEGLPYPEKDVRRIHRVAIALGGDEHFPVPFGDFGKGFVHVFDERSFSIVTAPLNTITDFGRIPGKERGALLDTDGGAVRTGRRPSGDLPAWQSIFPGCRLPSR